MTSRSAVKLALPLASAFSIGMSPAWRSGLFVAAVRLALRD